MLFILRCRTSCSRHVFWSQHILVLSEPVWRCVVAHSASGPENLVVVEMAHMVPGKRALPSRMCLGSSSTASAPGVPCNPHSHVIPGRLAKEISEV